MSVDDKSTYYDTGNIETIDIIKAKLTPDQYTGYLLGNIIKYSCRLNWKGAPERDAEKIAIYIKMLNDYKPSGNTNTPHSTASCECSNCTKENCE